MSKETFNPLDKQILGKSITAALLRKKPTPLLAAESFVGAGIYVIYYTGNFPAYKTISQRNRGGAFKAPIYVGKAIPEGGRKGLLKPNDEVGPVLYKRLRMHADSIRWASKTLKLEDFFCRHLLLDDVWIPLGESLLIQRFAPVWNQVLDGFGSNVPGGRRRKGRRSAWDTVHRGRPWADKCTDNSKTREQLLNAVKKALSSQSRPA